MTVTDAPEAPFQERAQDGFPTLGTSAHTRTLPGQSRVELHRHPGTPAVSNPRAPTTGIATAWSLRLGLLLAVLHTEDKRERRASIA